MIVVLACPYKCFFLFFNDPATTEIYTLSLHDALPISVTDGRAVPGDRAALAGRPVRGARGHHERDRKSTRLNSSHVSISYAVFCLKKKKNNKNNLEASHQARRRRQRLAPPPAVARAAC